MGLKEVVIDVLEENSEAPIKWEDLHEEVAKRWPGIEKYGKYDTFVSSLGSIVFHKLPCVQSRPNHKGAPYNGRLVWLDTTAHPAAQPVAQQPPAQQPNENDLRKGVHGNQNQVDDEDWIGWESDDEGEDALSLEREPQPRARDRPTSKSQRRPIAERGETRRTPAHRATRTPPHRSTLARGGSSFVSLTTCESGGGVHCFSPRNTEIH